ncbi:MAG TPA: acetate/propionate family kinase [Acidobacteriaceae bacterium]|nr:acetate/propionate family kinase [Acidobacteriaceae bacterium]
MAETPILVLNSGSSSLKFGLYSPGSESADEQLLLEGSAEGIGRGSGTLHIRNAAGDNLLHRDHILESQPEALDAILSALGDYTHATPIAVGHRVVHGGPHLREHTRITPAVLSTLEASVHFAPLHIPQSLALIHQAQAALPQIPQFACFDTAFHRTLPEVAAHLPIPTRFYEAGVIRYGFHGLSCESVVARLSPIPRRLIIAHLGNGSSITAVLNGKSVDTSMGLTPTGGIPMGTRSGDLDPGVLLYLLRNEKLSADQLEDLLNHQCGLFAFSNGESDMQALLAREASNDPAATLAIDAFCTAIRKYIGSYAALLGGLDLLVFTGGIGQHSSAIRSRISAGLDFLGLNPSKVLALPAQEELQIARHTRVLLGS